MESRTRKYVVAHQAAMQIKRAIPSADLVVGYALRRTLRSLTESIEDARAQAETEDPKLGKFISALQVTQKFDTAEEEVPGGRASYDKLMLHECTFDVHELHASVLEKDWPAVTHGTVEDVLPYVEWGDLLETLELINYDL